MQCEKKEEKVYRRKRYCGDKFIRQGEFYFPTYTKIDIYKSH